MECLQIFASSSAYNTGAALGMIIWILVLIYNLSLIPKGTHLKKTIISISLICVANLVGKLIPWVSGTPFGKIFAFLLSIATVCLVLVAIILAIWALFQFKKEPPFKGKSQAIWSLILGLLFIVLFTYGLVSNLDLKGIFNDFQQTSSSKAGEVIVLEKENFEITMPAKPWLKFDHTISVEAACLGLRRSKPEIYTVVIAETVHSSEELSIEAYKKSVLSNLDSAAESHEVISEEQSVVLNGLTWLVMEVDADVQGQSFRYQYYLTKHNGFLYQVITWSAKKNASQLEEELKKLMQSFRVRDMNLRAEQTFAETKEDFVSNEYGFSVDLKGDSWKKWEDLNEDAEYASFGVLGYPDTALTVVAASWPSQLKLSTASITRGLFALIDQTASDMELSKINDDENGRVDRIYSYKTDFLYRFRVIILEQRAYLVSAWSSILSEEEAARLIRDIQRVYIEDKAPDTRCVDYPGYPKFINQAGLQYYTEEDYGRARELFKLAFDAGDNNVYLENIATSFRDQKLYQEGLDLLSEHSELVEKNESLLQTKAELFEYLGKNEETYETLFKRLQVSPADSEIFIDFIKFAIKIEVTEKAMKDLEGVVDLESFEIKARVIWAEMLEKAKGADKAIDYLNELSKLKGFRDASELKKVQIYYRNKEYQNALKICNKMIEEGIRPLLYMQWKGDCQWALEWYAEARETFKESLEFDKDNEYSLDAIEKLNARLGQGDNQLIRSPINEVKMPDWVEVPSLVDNSEFGRDEDAIYEQYSHVIYFRPGEKMRRTITYIVKPLTDKGLKAFSTFKFTFDPLHERIFVNRLEVKNSKDEVLAEGSIENYYVMDDSSDNMADTDKVLHIPIPSLEKGLKLHLVVTRESLNQKKNIDFRQFYFNKSYPALWSGIFLDAESKSWKHFATEEVSTKTRDSQHLWFIKNPEVLDFENYMPAYEDVYSYVYVGPSDVSWEEIGEEYYIETLKPKLVTSDFVKGRVASLIADDDSDSEKLKKLASDVQKSIRYKAIEFGMRGIVPNSADKTFELRYGDCKDHALLLHVMLNEAGVSSSLALVDVDDRIHKEVPSLDQFDHMIVKVSIDGEDRYVDATNKFLNIWSIPPKNLLHKKALILGEQIEWGKIEPSNSEKEKIFAQKSVKLDDNFILVQEKLKLFGYFAENFRSWLNSVDFEDRKNRTQSMMRTTGIQVALKEIEFLHEDELNQPLEIKLNYAIPNVVEKKGEGFAVSVPAVWERYYLEMDEDANRKHPYQNEYPYNLLSIISIPDVEYAIRKDQKTTNLIFGYSKEISDQGMSFSARFKAGKLMPSDYEATRQAINEYVKILEKRVIINTEEEDEKDKQFDGNLSSDSDVNQIHR